jgi:hypothetical protein
MTEQPDFVFFECPECGFSSVRRRDFAGSRNCPICAGDTGRDVEMTARLCRPEDRPEGRDDRLGEAA